MVEQPYSEFEEIYHGLDSIEEIVRDVFKQLSDIRTCCIEYLGGYEELTTLELVKMVCDCNNKCKLAAAVKDAYEEYLKQLNEDTYELQKQNKYLGDILNARDIFPAMYIFKTRDVKTEYKPKDKDKEKVKNKMAEPKVSELKDNINTLFNDVKQFSKHHMHKYRSKNKRRGK